MQLETAIRMEFPMSKKTYIVFGSSKDDFLFTRDDGAQTAVFGSAGADVIEDQSEAGVIDKGRDFLWGNFGDDLLITHAGRDVLGGGDDNDTLVADRIGPNTSFLDNKTATLRGGSGDNTAIIVTDDPTFLDREVTAKDEVIDMGDYDVKLHRIQHLDFMTADEFAVFQENWAL
jgi:hypothetical protein